MCVFVGACVGACVRWCVRVYCMYIGTLHCMYVHTPVYCALYSLVLIHISNPHIESTFPLQLLGDSEQRRREEFEKKKGILTRKVCT